MLFRSRLDNGLIDFIKVQGDVYKKKPVSDDDVVFYDWIIDKTDVVRGLEIHLPPDHALLRSSIPLNNISQIESGCFVRLWFGNSREGDEQGKEAFGDIFFFGTDNNKLAIVVSLDAWLSMPQGKSLLVSLGLEKKDI